MIKSRKTVFIGNFSLTCKKFSLKIVDIFPKHPVTIVHCYIKIIALKKGICDILLLEEQR